jgi:hypothetical protein
MKPADFIDWLDSVKRDAKKGLIGQHNTKAALKIDGSAFHLGKSSSGRPFIEGARTGPQFDPGVFTDYAKKKNADNPFLDDILVRAGHYDEILRLFISSSKLKKLRDAIPNGAKVYCELFYTPMAQLEDETGVQFVTVKYDKKKIGRLMTLSIYGVKESETGKTHPREDDIRKSVLDASTSDVKTVSADLSFAGDIDISAEIDLLGSLLDDKEETKRIATSRKKVDKEKKMNVLSIINTVKERLEDKILFNPNICGQDRFCDISKGEGLVLHLKNTGQSVKVINPSFEQDHHGGKAK